jgi:integrase/recombinase XerD
MSGGPFGRGKAPERACMKLADWPKADRALWLAAVTPADPFSGSGGSRAVHRPVSNRNIARGYGRWLTFLSRRGLLDTSGAPADRISPEAVRAYVAELDALGNKKNTILARLEELTEMAKVMGRARDWGFLKRMSSRVRARHAPASSKAARLVGADELYALGLTLMRRAGEGQLPRRAALLFRDGLIIALLALRPLRRCNLADLTLGRDVMCVSGCWAIHLAPARTKTHVTLDYHWPESLLGALEEYLAVHRPVLASRRGRWKSSVENRRWLSADVENRLWISADGSPLTQMGLYDRLVRWTLQAFGRPINPHLFRDAAATTMAVNDPVHVLLAAPLLGHRTFATTERSYIQAQTLEAHRQFAAKLSILRHTNAGNDSGQTPSHLLRRHGANGKGSSSQ